MRTGQNVMVMAFFLVSLRFLLLKEERKTNDHTFNYCGLIDENDILLCFVLVQFFDFTQ